MLNKSAVNDFENMQARQIEDSHEWKYDKNNKFENTVTKLEIAH